MSVGSNADGGYLVPVEIEQTIGERLAAISPIRAHRRVRTISGIGLQEAVHDRGARHRLGRRDGLADADHVADARCAELSGDGALRHAGGDRDAARGCRRQHRRVARGRGRAGLRGAGGRSLRHRRRHQQAEGLPQLHDGGQRLVGWGNLGYIASGAAGAFAGDDPSDALVDLIYALKAGYRQNGAFVMNRKTQATIRKFKDSGGTYLWQPPAQAGGRASLMTFPLIEAEDMPDIAANSLSIAFGDFRRGYLVVDRVGVRVLRDPSRRNRTCCSTPPSASAAACRTSTRSS